MDSLLFYAKTQEDYNNYKEEISEDGLVFISDPAKLITPFEDYQFVPKTGEEGQVLAKTKDSVKFIDISPQDLSNYPTKKEVKDADDKLLEELNKKSHVVVCDNQYEFDQILTKDNNTIYLIKGDQDVWAAKEYVDELWDLVAELRAKLNNIEGVSLEDAAPEEPNI